MKLLEGKVALITGAARGIGKAIALKFASEGANIAFTDLVIDENGKATEAEIAALGVKVKGYASNAANFEETEKVVNQVKEDFGSVDILVNNAGNQRRFDDAYERSSMGRSDRRKSQIGIQLYPCLYPHHDASEIREHHQYGFGCRSAWKCRTSQLFSI